jgi:hypothetical protein
MRSFGTGSMQLGYSSGGRGVFGIGVGGGVGTGVGAGVGLGVGACGGQMPGTSRQRVVQKPLLARQLLSEAPQSSLQQRHHLSCPTPPKSPVQLAAHENGAVGAAAVVVAGTTVVVEIVVVFGVGVAVGGVGVAGDGSVERLVRAATKSAHGAVAAPQLTLLQRPPGRPVTPHGPMTDSRQRSRQPVTAPLGPQAPGQSFWQQAIQGEAGGLILEKSHGVQSN